MWRTDICFFYAGDLASLSIVSSVGSLDLWWSVPASLSGLTSEPRAGTFTNEDRRSWSKWISLSSVRDQQSTRSSLRAELLSGLGRWTHETWDSCFHEYSFRIPTIIKCLKTLKTVHHNISVSCFDFIIWSQIQDCVVVQSNKPDDEPASGVGGILTVSLICLTVGVLLETLCETGRFQFRFWACGKSNAACVLFAVEGHCRSLSSPAVRSLCGGVIITAGGSGGVRVLDLWSFLLADDISQLVGSEPVVSKRQD